MEQIFCILFISFDICSLIYVREYVYVFMYVSYFGEIEETEQLKTPPLCTSISSVFVDLCDNVFAVVVVHTTTFLIVAGNQIYMLLAQQMLAISIQKRWCNDHFGGRARNRENCE